MWLAFIINLTLILSFECAPEIKLGNGIIQGKTMKSRNGINVDAYLGIPFGLAPVGKLRFRHPEPAEPWEGVLNATEFSASCMQKVSKSILHLRGYSHFYLDTPISEDCLFLNVLVPNPKPVDGDVLVLLHAGSFQFLSPSQSFFDGIELAAEGNIIFVSINFRQNAFGYLYLDTPEIQGNAGLMDQVLGMKWVRDNIHSFAGNPTKVTLYGISSGAITTGYHMVSPLSKGLFRRVIMESGSPFFGSAILPNNTMERTALTIAEYIGCPDLKNKSAVANCLKSVPAEDIISNIPEFEDTLIATLPMIDGHFLPKRPEELFKENKFLNISVLTGYVKNEGTFFLPLVKPTIFNPTSNKTVPFIEDFLEGVDFIMPNSEVKSRERLVNHYVDVADRNNTQKILDGYDNFLNDYLLRCGIFRTTKYLTSNGNKVFDFMLAHRSKNSLFPKWMGVVHGTSVDLVFGGVVIPKYFDEEDNMLSKRIMRYWINFAKTGDPNFFPKDVEKPKNWIEWPVSEKNDFNVLVLENDNSTILKNYREKDCQLLNEVLKANKHWWAVHDPKFDF